MATEQRLAAAGRCGASQRLSEVIEEHYDKATPEERRERLRERMEDRRRSLIDQLDFETDDE